MRTQALFLEYLLLVVLAIFLLSYTISWFYNYRSDIFSSFLIYSNKLNEKGLVYTIEPLKALVNASVSIKTKDLTVFCNGPLLILKSDISCTPQINTTTFSGYLLNYTGILYWIYSNKTQNYYLGSKIATNLFKSCYERKISFIVNTTQCYIYQPCYGCSVNILKSNGNLIAYLAK